MTYTPRNYPGRGWPHTPPNRAGSRTGSQGLLRAPVSPPGAGCRYPLVRREQDAARPIKKQSENAFIRREFSKCPRCDGDCKHYDFSSVEGFSYAMRYLYKCDICLLHFSRTYFDYDDLDHMLTVQARCALCKSLHPVPIVGKLSRDSDQHPDIPCIDCWDETWPCYGPI